MAGIGLCPPRHHPTLPCSLCLGRPLLADPGVRTAAVACSALGKDLSEIAVMEILNVVATPFDEHLVRRPRRFQLV